MEQDKGKVLIFDNEEGVRQLLHEMLTNNGYRCLEVTNISEMQKSLRIALPDVVLLDILMPDEPWMDIIKEIKNQYPDMLVIVVTAISDLSVAIQCIRQGAYDYVTKPIDSEEVLNCLQRAMQTRKLQLELQNYRCHLEEKIEEQAEEIRETFLGAMSSLSFALEAKDSYTAGHSRRVADIAGAIGKKLNLAEDELEDLRWGSLLHDMAKIAVDERVLHKNGQLTPTEYEHIMTHTIVGACLAASVVRKKRIIEIIEHHHTHYNGRGLRQQLKGENIPLLARIVALADAYDAMTSNRPYRAALSSEAAKKRIREGIGRQFDPRVARAFLAISESEIETKRDAVLVADDDESIRLLVRSILGNDYAVIEAADGQQAIKLARNNKPALILMDIFMPGIDGLQACYELASNPATKEIPVIILTGINTELNKKLSSEFGAVDYITKPFTPQMLLDTVRKLVVKPKMVQA